MTKNIKHVRHQEQSCPKCRLKIDSATAIFNKEATPNVGDFSVCISCYSVLRYGENLQLHLSSVQEAENEQFGLGRQLEQVITSIRQVNARNNRDSN
ncbi:hypothetical protein [Nostoc sp.]|uniref:hypothetical protein n=1 Tax=Nostoc sp. TaxID=1180 RepID=UPI002FF8A227